MQHATFCGPLSPSVDWWCGFKEQRDFWNPAFTGISTLPICCSLEKTGTQNVSFGLHPATTSSCTNVFPPQMQWCWKLGKHAFTVGCPFLTWLMRWCGFCWGNSQSHLHTQSELVRRQDLRQMSQVGSRHLYMVKWLCVLHPGMEAMMRHDDPPCEISVYKLCVTHSLRF